ncbi:MAG: FecR family protein [Dysgonamonadaceae bacterium]|nr:FecR family protein [Dysgonamonadaceae bacterium]
MEDRITKYFLGELGQQETSELFHEMKTDNLLRNEFVRLQNLYALSHLSELSVNEEEGREWYERLMHKLNTNKHRKIAKLVFKYAAIAIVLIASTFFLTMHFYNNNAENNKLYVPAGQRAQLTLQDGTNVWLNAQSTLIYPSRFTAKERKVTIIGEAYFDVAKNSKKTFVVNTQNVEIQVLGTEFNVCSYPNTNYIQTNLVEGSLRVSDNRNIRKSVTLKPDDQLTIKDGQMFLSKTSNADYFLWKDGIYTFDNEKLIDIIKKLELYYDVTIKIEDPEIFDVRYTGKFRQRDGIEEILRIIQKIQKFNIHKDRENNIITLTKYNTNSF